MFSISDLSRMLNLDRRIVMHVIKQHGVPAYRLVKANMYALPEVVAAINATKHYNYSRSQRGPTA